MSRPQTPEEKDARMWAMFCHLGGLLVNTLIPFANIITPLVIWMLKREEFAFVDDQGKEALNFQISTTLYLIVCILLAFLLIGIPLIFVLWIFHFVFTIVGAIKAYDGVYYRYPLTIRFVR